MSETIDEKNLLVKMNESIRNLLKQALQQRSTSSSRNKCAMEKYLETKPFSKHACFKCIIKPYMDQNLYEIYKTPQGIDEALRKFGVPNWYEV